MPNGLKTVIKNNGDTYILAVNMDSKIA